MRQLQTLHPTWNIQAVCGLLSTPVLLLAQHVHAQATLPPAQPTQTSVVQPAQPIQPAQPVPRASPHHLQVLYAAGSLTIHAENASLNGILREVSRTTGMSITGGVQDERVYGVYGPADTGTVLATLLAGTGSNMLLEESTLDRPLTLVLTPRQGGPTPPSPANTPADPDEDRSEQADLPPQQTRPSRAPQTVSQPGNQPTALSPSAQPATQPVSDQSAPTSITDQQSPNGVKTPQQIYDQLMKLKQQQPATTPQR